MTADQKEWIQARDELISTVTDLGFPKKLGIEIVKKSRESQSYAAYEYLSIQRKAEKG